MEQQEADLQAAHLTEVREDSDISECFWPPVIQPRSAHAPGAGETDRKEVMVGAESSPDPNQQWEAEAKRSLLDELGRIEADLRVGLRVDAEAEFLRRQQNQLQRTHLCHLSLSQRVARPWVNSYFRRFPMHIYCLPVQATNHRARRGVRRRKK